MGRRILTAAAASAALAVASAQSQLPGQAPAAPRDTPAQAAPAPTGRITGRVLAADTGRPLRRARVFASAAQFEGRGTLTDDNGVFALSELPAGRFTVTASKVGYLTLSFGQRRPLQAGTPLQLSDGEQLTGVEFRLPRGSVIAGRVFDETGEPLPGATVRAARYQYAQGERQLVAAGSAQTDDQGAFRIWGLNPGEYYVSAVARNAAFGPPGRGGFTAGSPARSGGGPADRGSGGGVRGAPAPVLDSSADEELAKAYAPTYYPGVGSIDEARPLAVGVGQDLLDVSFPLLLVHTARVAGSIVNPDGSPVSSGQVSLTPEASGAPRGRSQPGIGYAGRINWEGRFTIDNVPPGRYVLRARATDSDPPLFAAQPLAVASGDALDLAVVVAPGATISGSVLFEGTDAPDPSLVRVTAPPADGGASLGPTPTARVDRDGRFTLEGVPAGSHWIRMGGSLRGWSLKSVLADGRDVIDTPLDLRSGQQLANVALVFTSRQTEITGTVTTTEGVPVTDFTVLAFPFDPALWRPQSRHIATARPDQTGRFQIRGLPPGAYYVAVVDPLEQGEWFEPAFLDQQRGSAATVTLGEGDVKTQDFKIAVR